MAALEKIKTIPTWTLIIPAVLLIASTSLTIQKCSAGITGNDRRFVDWTLAFAVVLLVVVLLVIFQVYIRPKLA